MSNAIDMLAMLLTRGGWVMWPLLVISVVSLTMCLERAWFWLRMGRETRGARWTEITAALRRGERATLEKQLRGDHTVYGRVLRRLLKHGATGAMAMEAIESERPRLERFMMTLSTVITAAPLLGILGTVTGIIGSFQLLGEARLVTDPREVSGGIAEALITTAAGLVIAIVTLFPYMVFRAQLDRALSRLETLVAAAREGLASESRESSS